jgi:hypothetical protein
MLLLTPVRSEVFQVKTSLSLSRNESSSTSYSGDRSWVTIIVLFGTLGSSGTLLVSHSGSMAGLVAMPALLLVVSALWCPSVSSSYKQFRFGGLA